MIKPQRSQRRLRDSREYNSCLKRLGVFCLSSVISVFIFLLILAPDLQAQNAPVTTAGRVTNAVPGDPAVPVDITVTNFSNIGQFTLTMKFDTLKVKYVSFTTNPSLPGMTVNYTPPSGNSLGKLVLAWTGASNVSLADGSAIAGLIFRYVNGTGLLKWNYTYGSVCQYRRYSGTILTALADSPRYQYYQNGGISNRTSPYITAPVVPDPVAGNIHLPLAVNSFTDIGGFTLYVEYDPSIITYLNSFTKNEAFDSNFIVGDNPGTGSNRYLVVQWYGSPVNLEDNDTLCTLDFNYISPTCSSSLLGWYDTGPTCEYSDGSNNVLIDMPQPDYYSNGIVEPGLPATWTGLNSSDWNDPQNWNSCGIPDLSKNAVIPDVAPNAFPVIASQVHCKSLRIQTGATLTVSLTGEVIIGE
jgi:hypothetical protein